MLQCNLIKSDESTFFVLNVYWVFVRNWVLPYINENAKRLAASILMLYRKIPKISPGAYIFQRPFLRGLFLEGLIFGGAYLRRKICVSKLIGLAL